MPQPLVAIVGRPNVGKSTLFNRLIGRRVAIVEDTPGITRDRLYHDVTWLGRCFTVIDTGGIVLNESDPLTAQVLAQAEIAVSESDVILFMVDAVDGLIGADEEIADVLRASRRPVLLVANKADNARLEDEAAEFHALGFGELHAVSAAHGRGIADLLDATVAHLPDESGETGDDADAIGLAIVGRPNVGKSSLLNAVLGQERVIVSPSPGTTRDTIDTTCLWEGHTLTLLDTAGIRRNRKIQGTVEYYMVLRAKAAIQRSDVAMVVVDAAAGLLDGDKRVAGLALEAGCACVIVVNKWDLVDPAVCAGGSAARPDKARMRAFTDSFHRDAPFLSYAPLAFVSAKLSFGIRAAVDAAISAAENHAHRIPTGELNRIVRDAVDRRPLVERGRALKIYYATMPRVKPPTVVLFCNDPDLLHFSYRRYVENRLRAVYPLEGSPIRIEARKAPQGVRATL